MKWKNILVLSIIIYITGCIPATDEAITEVTLKTNDPLFQKIVNFQDKQLLDSLLTFTNHPDPSYRYLVANSLASIQDPRGIDSLNVLLQDPVMKVRTAAAYALGQLRNNKASASLLDAFKKKDTLNVNTSYNATILEAIGKVGSENLLSPLATVSTYRNTDTLLLLGQTRAIYEYALRGITRPEGTDKMIQYISEPGFPEEVRLIASNYLYRSRDLDVDAYKFRIAEVFQNEKDPNIRMALAIVLGRTKDKEVFDILKTQFDQETDYRVRTNIVRALSDYPYIQVVDQMLALLRDENHHIASTAADFLINHGNRNDALIYRDFIKDDQHYSINAKIYSAILKHLPTYFTTTRNIIKRSIKDKISSSSDPHEKAAYIAAFGYDPLAYKEIIDLSSESKHGVVRSSGAYAVSNIMTSPRFVQTFRNGQRRVKREILTLIKQQILTADAGLTSIYGELLANPEAGFKEVMDSVGFIEKTMGMLSLPKEIESYNSLSKALTHLTNTTYTPKKVEWNHPINWGVLSTYGDSAQVAIKTSKGVIRAEMFTIDAPGSVSNFLKLSQDDFYDGKTFHRVVPNFVIQGGCPRGDGYGALEYTIRSEVPQRYYDDEGYIGMASAGLHTEGTQFFITHSPTMHLNGKYTIFGKVTDGMDVVHNIEQGDIIEDIIITK